MIIKNYYSYKWSLVLSKINLLIKIVNFFFNVKYYFFFPNKKKYILITSAGEIYFKKIFRKNLYVIDVNKSINIYILFSTFFECVKKKNLDPYYEEYIKKIDPKFVFCFAHNYMQFFRLKKNIQIKYIMVQNGTNSGNNQFLIHRNFLEHKKYKCDYFFYFNDLDLKLFKSVVISKYIKIGSFLSNSVKRQIRKKIKIKSICFISTFRNLKENKYKSEGSVGRDMTFDEFYKPEELLFKFLVDYCKKRKLMLKIIGSTQKEGHKKEKLFFSNLLGNNKWFFLPKHNFKSSYLNVDENYLACFIDSALGYESLARGNLVAAFGFRGSQLRIPGFNFCRGKLKKHGLFWCTSYNEKKFTNILDYLIAKKDTFYNSNKKFISKFIAYYDPGNTSFFKVLRKYDENINKSFFYFN
jgi:surface carbohydrate biosynthesis protein